MNKTKIEKLNFQSSALQKVMPLLVYLPPKYDKEEALPVLYFLHGRNVSENMMFDVMVDEKAEQLINEGRIPPMIIVCPGIGNSRGMNSASACSEVLNSENRIYHIGMYEDYLIKELIPFIDNTYNTISDRSGRFIGGASAGGFAALHNAFRHQDLFSKVGGHMPAIELSIEEEDRPHFSSTELWEKYDPVHIAKKMATSSDIKVYLDAGEEDEGGFYEGCAILHKVLETKGVNSQNHVFPGYHNVEYIKSNIEKYLIFYGNGE
jgi:enterochelin esterase-like enzyme